MHLTPAIVSVAQRAYALSQQGHFQEALDMTEGLLDEAPHPSILNLAALCARSLGLSAKAEGYLRAAIDRQPDYVVALNNLGLVLGDQERYAEAEAVFRQALTLSPADPNAATNLGNLYRALKQFDAAEEAYLGALAKVPELVNARYNLSLLYLEQERFVEAEGLLLDSLKMQPGQADLYNALGSAHHHTLRFDEAEAAYRRAIALQPDYADAHCNLGILLFDQGRHTSAAAAFRQALETAPTHVDALSGLARVMLVGGQIAEAEQTYQRALTLRPDSPDLLNNFGNLLRDSRRWTEAELAYRKAFSLDPHQGHALGQAMSCARYNYDWSRLVNDDNAVLDGLMADLMAIPPLTVLAIPNVTPQLHRRASERTASKALQSYLTRQPIVDRSARRLHTRLKIGYLSSEFHTHPVMYLLAGVLASHDRSLFEIHAYSTGPIVRDAYRIRAETSCEFFHDISTSSPIDSAQAIARDEIDILIDLSGYAGYAKPAITALRPAPVIVNWLGYPGSLGLPRLADYIIGDAVLTPLEHADYYSETIAWMPHCYQPNDDAISIVPTPTRREAGLPEQSVVFCSFNQAYKLTPALFTLWCRLLKAVPDSVLWLQKPTEAQAMNNFLREAAQRDVAADRFVFAPRLEISAHIARLKLADLALDTYPYGSGATGSNALRAGDPSSRCWVTRTLAEWRPAS